MEPITIGSLTITPLKQGLPNTGNSVPAGLVKTEEHDEAEIKQLAAKIKEAMRNKNLTKQVERKIPVQVSKKMSSELGNTSNGLVIDEESARSRFGWEQLGDCFIPYIFRSGEKYFAVRILEMKVLNKFLSYFHPDIYKCLCIKSFYITEVESKLFNDINFRHSDQQYGLKMFTQNDLIVLLNDAKDFYNFLNVCYDRIMQGNCSSENKCGFFSINKTSIVPYVSQNDTKYIPLFYFEEAGKLKSKTVELDEWNMSLLKFCGKIQGIKDKFFKPDPCAVVSFDTIKSHFPSETEFKDYWPDNSYILHVLLNKNAPPLSGQWTMRPPTLPVVTARTGSVSTACQQGEQIQQRNRSTLTPRNYTPVVLRDSGPQNIPPRPIQHTALSVTRTTNTAIMPQRFPPPLLPLQKPQQRPQLLQNQTDTTCNSTNQSTLCNSNNQQLQSTIKNKNGSSLSITNDEYDGPVQKKMRTLETSGNHNSINQQHSNISNLEPIKKILIPIAETETSGRHIPYIIQRVFVEQTMIPCINIRPYVFTELLVTIPDLIKYLFTSVNASICTDAICKLGIKLFRGNSEQMKVLKKGGSCKNVNDALPLVLIKDIVKHMPQIKYMFKYNS